MHGLGGRKLLKTEQHQFQPKGKGLEQVQSTELELVLFRDVNVCDDSLATFRPLCRCHVLLVDPRAHRLAVDTSWWEKPEHSGESSALA